MNEFFSKCDVIGHVKLGGVRHSILFSFQFEFVWTFRAWCKYSWKENASLSRKMLAPLTFPSVNALLEFPSVRAMEGPSCSLSFSEHGRLKVETELQVMEMVTSATGCMPQVRNLTGKDFHFLLPQGTWTCVPFRHHVYLHSFLIKKKIIESSFYLCVIYPLGANRPRTSSLWTCGFRLCWAFGQRPGGCVWRRDVSTFLEEI